jgi:tRNA(His) 5'-end guanylyltransferase
MKAKKLTEFETWSLKSISTAYGISQSNLRYRCQKLKIYPVTHNGNFEYRLNRIDIDRVLEYAKRKDDSLPEIIYVHTTWTILESKLNF